MHRCNARLCGDCGLRTYGQIVHKFLCLINERLRITLQKFFFLLDCKYRRSFQSHGFRYQQVHSRFHLSRPDNLCIGRSGRCNRNDRFRHASGHFGMSTENRDFLFVTYSLYRCKFPPQIIFAAGCRQKQSHRNTQRFCSTACQIVPP